MKTQLLQGFYGQNLAKPFRGAENTREELITHLNGEGEPAVRTADAVAWKAAPGVWYATQLPAEDPNDAEQATSPEEALEALGL